MRKVCEHLVHVWLGKRCGENMYCGRGRLEVSDVFKSKCRIMLGRAGQSSVGGRKEGV